MASNFFTSVSMLNFSCIINKFVSEPMKYVDMRIFPKVSLKVSSAD